MKYIKQLTLLSFLILSPTTHAFITITDGWDGPGLGSAELTYYFVEPDNIKDLTPVKAAFTDIFAEVSSIVDISFTEVFTPFLDNSLDIAFQDFFSIGVDYAAAFTYVPPSGVGAINDSIPGDMVFDSTTNYKGAGFSPIEGVFDISLNFALLAAHELGHALGLDHSDNDLAVMNGLAADPLEYYMGLHADDIAGLRSLYAPASSVSAVPVPGAVWLMGTALIGLVTKRKLI
jgi:hypothetical protein